MLILIGRWRKLQLSTPVENVSLPTLAESKTQIVTSFYDHEADQEDQEQALVFYNNKFYQSQGIDIAATDDGPFPVIAALSGEVIEVKENPVLGLIVQLKHDHDVTTFYSSLTDVEVKEGQSVSQGDVIAHAGTNVFNKDIGVHVHFEIRKDGDPVNPESYIDQSVAELTTSVAENPAEPDDERKDREEQDIETSLPSPQT